MKTDEKQKDNKRNNHEGKDKSNQNTSQNMDHVIIPKQSLKFRGKTIYIFKKAHFNTGNINKAQNVEIYYILVNYYN